MKRIILFILLLILYSCSIKSKKSEYKQIDKVRYEVNYLKHNLKLLNVDSLIYIVKDINRVIDSIKDMKGKAIDEQFNYKYIIPLNDISNIFGTIWTKKTELLKEISQSEKQLNNLRTDVKNGVINTVEFKDFVYQEKKAAELINAEIIDLKVRMKYNVYQYNRLKYNLGREK